MGNRRRIDIFEVSAANNRADDGGAAPMRQLSSQRTNRTQHPVHQNRFAGDRAVAEHGPVSRDPRNSQARAHLVGDFIDERNGLQVGHAGQLRGGAEWPVRLCAIGPHPLPDPAAVHAVADGVDHAGTVAVRDDPRETHRISKPAGALLRIAGIDAGEANPYPDFARARFGSRQLPDLQHLCRGTLSVVPGRQHVSRTEHGAERLRRSAARSRNGSTDGKDLANRPSQASCGIVGLKIKDHSMLSASTMSKRRTTDVHPERYAVSPFSFCDNAVANVWVSPGQRADT